MAKINLVNGYFIEADSMGYTLKRVYIGKVKGKEQEKEAVCGYFGLLSLAIGKFIHLNKVDKLGDTALEFKEYVERVEAADKAAVQAIHKALKALEERENG